MQFKNNFINLCKREDLTLDELILLLGVTQQDIEGWIKENPSQWFWVHDRWGIKDVLKKKFKGEKNATKNNK